MHLWHCSWSLITNTFHLYAYAKPEVSISPSCGAKSGFNVLMKADGLAANSVFAWKLVDSDGKAALSGYFYADKNGEVKDEAFIEDVKKGHYKLNFGDDTNNDGELDSEIGHSDIVIPCQNK
jgi:hypothetical protein